MSDTKKIALLALAASAFCAPAALAANWVKTPPNSTGMTALYDADSAYVQKGLVYAVTCGDEECTARAPAELFGPEPLRIDCATKIFSDYSSGKWSAPVHLAKESETLNSDEYVRESDSDLLVTALCAQKDSWPQR